MPEETVAIRAWYFEDTLDTNKFRAANPHYPVLAQDPLILNLQQGHYAILTRFGGVVFWNYEETSAQRLRDEIFQIISDRSFSERIEDQLPVILGVEKDEVLPNAVRLKKADLPRIRIVATAIAQSVALDRLENQLEDALRRLLTKIDTLKEHGTVRSRVKDILQTVGFAMSAKHAILSSLTLIDMPEETWESPELEKLYRELYDDTFDLNDRVRALDSKLAFLEECVTILLEIINSKRLVWLEVAVVVLILVEIVLMLMMWASSSGHP